MYIDLYQHLDTGATSSLISFDSYEHYDNIQPLSIKKIKLNTVAVTGKKLKVKGFTTFDPTLDTNTDNSVRIKAWISAKDGCDLNILGMNFFSQNSKSNIFQVLSYNSKNTKI